MGYESSGSWSEFDPGLPFSFFVIEIRLPVTGQDVSPNLKNSSYRLRKGQLRRLREVVAHRGSTVESNDFLSTMVNCITFFASGLEPPFFENKSVAALCSARSMRLTPCDCDILSINLFTVSGDRFSSLSVLK